MGGLGPGFRKSGLASYLVYWVCVLMVLSFIFAKLGTVHTSNAHIPKPLSPKPYKALDP